MKNPGIGCLLTFLAVALLMSVAFNCLQLIVTLNGAPTDLVQQKERFSELLEQPGEAGTHDKIVRLDLEGMISSGEEAGLLSEIGMDVDLIKRALEQAVADPDVKAIVLRVNSPGGEVTASDTLYHAVKQAAANKPVVVYMDSTAASGGYYLSCGATKIIANETTLTGSIGVIIQSVNYSQTFGKIGLETLTFASGKFKDTLSGSRPMRDDEKAYVQKLVSQMYDKFVGIVADARKLDKDTLVATIADGRVLTGAEALQHKLVDQVGYIEDAYTAARELGQAPEAMVVKYQHLPSFSDIFGMFGHAAASRNSLKIDVSDRLLPRLSPGRAYLLPAHMVP
ncbi:MAG: signal peptide peptidase SppA [Roseimicrobium sp.]